MGIKDRLLGRFPKKATEAEVPQIQDNSDGKARQKIVRGVRRWFQKPPSEPELPEPEVAENERISQEETILQRARRRFEKELADLEMPNLKAKFRGLDRRRILQVFRRFQTEAKLEDIQEIDEKLPGMNRGPIKEIWPKIQTLAKTIRDPNTARTSKILAIAALVYLVSPWDAVPDLIPVAGLIDDVAVIAAVVSTLTYELKQDRDSLPSAEAPPLGDLPPTPKPAQSNSQEISLKSVKSDRPRIPLISPLLESVSHQFLETSQKEADIQITKYNRIVRITLIGSILAALLTIAVKYILSHL